MKQRFERCKTPSGSVPISVIMGFDYPLGFSKTFLTAVGKLLIILKLFDCLLVVRVKCTYEPAQRQTERRVGGGREGRPPPTL